VRWPVIRSIPRDSLLYFPIALCREAHDHNIVDTKRRPAVFGDPGQSAEFPPGRALLDIEGIDSATEPVKFAGFVVLIMSMQ